MSDIDARTDPRFDAIIARMQTDSETMTPTEVLARALADAYIVGAEDGKQERDDLRAKVAGLKRQRDLAEQDARQRLRAQLDTARYVRELEEALQSAQAYRIAKLYEQEAGISQRVLIERMQATSSARQTLFAAIEALAALAAKDVQR